MSMMIDVEAFRTDLSALRSEYPEYSLRTLVAAMIAMGLRAERSDLCAEARKHVRPIGRPSAPPPPEPKKRSAMEANGWGPQLLAKKKK